MKRAKGCFNEKCTANKKKFKYDDAFDFCPKCGNELDYVCKDRKCYEPLSNVLKKYCDGCLAERKARKEKTQEQVLKIAEDGAKVIDVIKDGAKVIAPVGVIAKNAPKVIGPVIDMAAAVIKKK
jgi:hypothetical protein